MDDPADVARPKRPQAHVPRLDLAAVQRRADIAHRLGQPLAPALADRRQKRIDLRPGGGFSLGEGFPVRRRQSEQPMLAVVGAHAALREPTGAESGDDAAQMRLVHAERPADVRRRPPGPRRVDQFVENARLRQRQVGRRQAPVQKPDLPGVKPVEAANLVGERH